MSALHILTAASNLKNLSFLKAFGAQKVTDGIKAATDALVAFDPKGATEAQISIMDGQLDQLGQKVAQTKKDYDDAKAAFDASNTLRVHRLTAAETLDAAIKAGDTSKQTSLTRLLDIIEKADPELDALRKDADDAKAYLDDLQTAYDAAAEKLKSARSELVRAQRDMSRAEIQQERAEDKAEAAAIAAGVRGASDSLNTALSAMRRKADEAKVAADAANLKASTLAPQDHETDDPHIAEALAAASGAPTKFDSPSDRLAALKNRAA